jgi:hypothetical protein
MLKISLLNDRKCRTLVHPAFRYPLNIATFGATVYQGDAEWAGLWQVCPGNVLFITAIGLSAPPTENSTENDL